MKKTRNEHLRKARLWAITICAVAVAVFAVIKGQYALAVWPIIAALFNGMADSFQTLSEDAIEYGDAMMLENMELSSKLCDAQLKIIELEHQLRTKSQE